MTRAIIGRSSGTWASRSISEATMTAWYGVISTCPPVAWLISWVALPMPASVATSSKRWTIWVSRLLTFWPSSTR